MKSTLAFLFLLALAAPAGPAASQTRQAAITGLKGEYYAGIRFDRLIATRTDRSIDFTWSHVVGRKGFNERREMVAPAPGVPEEFFSVRWTGMLVAPESGTYTLEVSSDDGVRVWLGGMQVLNAWELQQETRYTAEVELKAGAAYPLKVEYFQQRLDAVVHLAWRLPSQPQDAPTQPIGTAFFRPAAVMRPQPMTPVPTEEPGAADEKGQAATQAATPPPGPPFRAGPAPQAPPARMPAQQTAQPPARIELQRGQTITLPNLYFELNTAGLLPGSEPTLDGLVAAMKAQPALRIEIAGHTDIAKDKNRSRELSRQRAGVVRDYLVESGIDSSRIATVGYGCSRPLVRVSDAKNRRVEVAVR